MLINNEFIIERYLGAQPLTLLSPPANLDSSDLLRYNTFINNISTIYGSQNSNGIIPIFYKTSSGAPSTASTLTQLDSGQEYYFISQGSAVFPYTIPAIGGTISSPSPPTCESLPPCCPTVTFSNSPINLSGSANIYSDIMASVSGLVPGKQYSYAYSSISANWPSKITPMSGVFRPSASGDMISSIFNFIPSTGNCLGCFPYQLDQYSDKDFGQKNIYSILSLKITSPDQLNCPIAEDTLTVKCNECLPTPCAVNRPKVSFLGGPKLSLSSNCCSVGVPVVANITGAEPGKTYSFIFENWPSDVQISPSTGTSGFGDGSGKIACMINMAGQTNAIVKCSLTDPISSETFVDFVTIQCSTSC